MFKCNVTVCLFLYHYKSQPISGVGSVNLFVVYTLYAMIGVCTVIFHYFVTSCAFVEPDNI
jgi:hypothetical protein